jgi:hypothetical protein
VTDGPPAPVHVTDTIINVKFVLHEFDPNLMQSGQSAFPFSVNLPEWLPESFILQQGETQL